MPPLKQNKPRTAFDVVASDTVRENTVSVLAENRIFNDLNKIYNSEETPIAFIHRDKIYPNPLNKKYMRKMKEEHFQTIKLSLLAEGQMHNIVVIDDGHGRYRLISGEKRWTAFTRMTKEEYESKFPKGIHAKIIPYDPNLSQLDEHITLLSCNVITYSNDAPDLEQLRDLINLYNEKGYARKELVEYLGNYLTISNQAVYKLVNEAQAIDELMDLTDKKVINRAALQCLGGLSKEEQKKIYDMIIEEGIEKVDQDLAMHLKRELKKKKKKGSSDESMSSASFLKYRKSLESLNEHVDKYKKIKIDNMNEMELSFTVSKIENLINKLNEQKNNLSQKINEKKQ